MSTPTLQQIASHAKTYGFLYNSSEIYQGLQAVYDYGPYGVQLKKNLQDFWWYSMTQLHHNIVGLDAAILMAPAVWEASGHLAGFHDWMVDNKDSKKRYRVDLLLEEQAAKWKLAGQEQEAIQLSKKMDDFLSKEDGDGLTSLLQESHVVCPISKTAHWTKVKRFNLMFRTEIGSVANEATKIYLRPETAQGIFVNFLNVQKSTRLQIPFGIAQIGKAFRNEIIARQFIFRMREFEQMEMQFFVPPEEEQAWFDHWVAKRKAWYSTLGIPKEAIRIHPHTQLAHYAKAAVDITYRYPFGYKEVEGIHARGCFDLQSHANHSGKKIKYFDTSRNASYIPHVVETSVGTDRLLLLLLCHAFTQTTKDNTPRTYLKFPPPLAPTSAAILPLFKKEPLIKQAQAILKQLQPHFRVAYDQSQSIGKRYVRQDLIGTPYCITVDYETLEDQQVTIRERDTMTQQRMPIGRLKDYLKEQLHLERLISN